MSRFTVLELSDSEAKVLQVSHTKKTGLLMEDAFSLDLGNLDRDDTAGRGARIREFLKQKKITLSPCGLLIPKQNSIVRLASLPSADPAELAQMAHFKAEEYIPFNAERHIISHGILRVDAINGSQVLIAAVDGPVMDKAMAICREAGIETLLAEVTSIALVRSLTTHEPKAHEEPSLLALNIGRSQTDISILKDGLLVATRSQPVGIDRLNRDMEKAGEESSDQEPQDIAIRAIREWIDKIVRFTRQTYEVAVREHDISHTAHLYISGEGGTLQGLAKALEAELHVEVTVFNPAEKVGRAAKNNVDISVVPGMAAAMGTVQRLIEEEENPKLREGRVNLLPLGVLRAQEASERRLLLMIGATMLFITLVLLSLAFDRQSGYNRDLANRLKAYNRDMRREVEDLDEKQEQIKIVESRQSDRAPAMEILDQLSRFPGIGTSLEGGHLTLSSFQYTQGEEVTIAGDALELENIGEFTDYLERMNYGGKKIFQDVGIPTNAPVELSRNRGTIWQFTLNARLNTSATEEASGS